MQCGLNGSDVLAGSEGSGIEMSLSQFRSFSDVRRGLCFFCILAACEIRPLLRAGSGQTVSPTPGVEMIVFFGRPFVGGESLHGLRQVCGQPSGDCLTSQVSAVDELAN